MNITIPDTFADVWHGPAAHAEEAHALGVLSHIARSQDSRITAALSVLSPRSLLEMIAEADDESLTSRAQLLGYAEAELREMRQRLLRANDVFDIAKRSEQTLLTIAEGALPAQFRDLDVAPFAFWTRGDLALLDTLRAGITMDGVRAATGYGEWAARNFAEEAARADLTVVSGGAFGIQGAAHRAVLSVAGKPVIISGNGIDRAFPTAHDTLHRGVIERGLVITEVSPGTPPTKSRFIARSRLMAAATAATVIVEAGYRSGALLTAGVAMNLGRISAAVPGPITNPASAGCHELIAQGTSQLVGSWSDLQRLLQPALVD